MANQLAIPEATIDDFGEVLPDARKMQDHSGRVRREPKTARRKTPPVFVLIGRRNPEQWFLIKKGDKLRRPLTSFPTYAEAKQWRQTIGQEEAEALWKFVRERDFISDLSCRGLENRPRTGPDHRHGEDITPAEFLKVIQPRGVQFGLWQDNRDAALNSAFDAVCDLAGFLGKAPAWPFHFGKVGLAFGARGSGHAAAHYEPSLRVINLTKTQGPGCLAHELAHALDHELSHPDPLSSDARVKAVVRGLPKTLVARSEAADATRSSGRYFSKPCEMFARAFESWVNQEVDNDYLVNIKPVDQFKAPDRFPYAHGDELLVIGELFEQFLSEL